MIRMTTTAIVLVNAALAIALIGALTAVARIAFRMRHTATAETLHPSQPLPLRLVAPAGDGRRLARAA
jgi:hypothetical protein